MIEIQHTSLLDSMCLCTEQESHLFPASFLVLQIVCVVAATLTCVVQHEATLLNDECVTSQG